MGKIFFTLLYICISIQLLAQSPTKGTIRFTIINEHKGVLPGSTVALLNADSVAVYTGAADAMGIIEFKNLDAGRYSAKASQTGYDAGLSQWIDLQQDATFTGVLVLKTNSRVLTGVTVLSNKPFIQFLPDKTVINPEANITNAGATVMEILEKSPGITVGKDGSIIMKGKPSVMVLIDGKPTQLSGSDLQAYLSGMSAAQVDVVELIENPGARYDASGNSGIINIRTKATKIKGFNGNLNLSIGQGRYTKTGNSLNLNYRQGKVNWFMNYGMRAQKDFMEFWTLRSYFDQNNKDSALLEQPGLHRNTVEGHNLKTGIDFFASAKTTIGLIFTGSISERNSKIYSDITWMDPSRKIDSTINTQGTNYLNFKRGGVNLYARHKISATSDISADIDYVRFNVNNEQRYTTQLVQSGAPVFVTEGNIPSKLKIITAKIDYTKQFKSFTLETGLKTAINKTDNIADYYYYDNNRRVPDLSRSNHFLYDENISAAYASVDAKKGKWHWQTGLRYEYTTFNANQLGNAEIKDSAFSKKYGSFFPTAFLSFEADSNHTFTFRIGRRIDRPPFQFLNPFLRTLNKYTYEGGNPFITPQYTWNFALAHTYKQMLTTEFSYSYLTDYFSQIFIIDSNSSNVNKNIIIYTRSNVGSFQNFGISETFQKPLTKWWNITATATYNHKIIKGVIWRPLTATIDQLNVSLNNQFRFGKGWGFEVSGYYQTRSQIDLQEWLKPQGELNLGVSKQILKNKGSLKLNVRDLTYFYNYSGFSIFENSTEPFTLKFDTRVVRLTFSWRFGKQMKAVNRSQGGAQEEIDRVGNGN